MYCKLTISLLVMLVLISGCVDSGNQAHQIEIKGQLQSDIERGRQVIGAMGCNHCHTPDYMMKRSSIPEDDWLVGSALGFRSPLGTAYPTNLRLWFSNASEEDWLVSARRMPEDSPMAWVMLSKSSDQDLRAIYRFIKYLGPKGVPALPRLGAGVMPTTQYMDIPSPH